MPQEQYSKLVGASDDLVHQQPPPRLQMPILAGKLVDRKHGIVARVIGIMHCGSIESASILLDGEVGRDRDGLAMGDEKAVKRSFERGPASHARRGAGAVEIDGGIAAEIVATAVLRKMLLVRAPAEFGWLAAFADEPFD